MKAKNTKTILTALNSDVAPAATAAVVENPVEAIRSFGQSMETQLNSLVDCLEDPLKTKFMEIKTQVNTMLAGLPETDKVPAATAANDVLQRLLSVMYGAQSMMTSVMDMAKNAKSTAMNSLTVEVEKAIKSKVDAGEFVAKADVEAKIEAATKAGREAAAAESKLRTERVTALASLNIPTPSDAILSAKDEEFATAKDAAQRRVDALKDFKVPADKLVTLCWEAPDTAFDLTVSVLKENAVKPEAAPVATPATSTNAAPVVKEEPKPAKANAFVGGSTPEDKANKAPMLY